MHRIFAGCLLASLFNFQQAKAWEFIYIDGSEAGTVKACAAIEEYTDGFFLIRLQGESIEFVIRMDHLTLPYGTILGNVAFTFPEATFVLGGSTNPKDSDDTADTTPVMFLEASPSDYADLYDNFLRSSQVEVIFPNGESYSLPLKGSGTALRQASECWKNRPTGPYNNNPFDSAPSGGNPFRSNEPPATQPQPPKPVASSNPFSDA